MIGAVSTKNVKYDYLVLMFKMTDQEREIWEALFERDKAVLSAGIYSMVAHEMPALTESARIRQPRNTQKLHVRRLFLLALPEYVHVIRFIRSNLRRPAFKDHLKRLIFHVGNTLAQSAIVSASTPAAEAAGVPEPTHIPILPDFARRSPRELFSDPNKLLQTILLELNKPEAERLFIWNAIPPDEYPEEVKKGAPFFKLERLWRTKTNIV